MGKVVLVRSRSQRAPYDPIFSLEPHFLLPDFTSTALHLRCPLQSYGSCLTSV